MSEHRVTPRWQWMANPPHARIGYRVAVCGDCGRPIEQDAAKRWVHARVARERVA